MMSNNYGGVVWTKHALERLTQRGIPQSDAYYTFQHPEQSRFAASQGAWIYYRNYDGQKIEVVAKQNEKKEWLIISVWSDRVGRQQNGEITRSWLTILRKIFRR